MIELRPKEGDFSPYYNPYIQLVPEHGFLQQLINSQWDFVSFLEKIPKASWDYRYAPDKWTLKEVVLHLMDTERVMAYRALRIARNDQTPMAGFDQDEFVPESYAELRSVDSILEEYPVVRESTLQLFANFLPHIYERTGIASKQKVSVLALGFIIAGHELHHEAVIKEKYLKELNV